jgi:GNAT superfamily N-acetyltransferase
MEEVVELVNYVFRTSGGMEPTMGRQFPTIFCPDNASDIYVAADEGRIIANIAIKRNTGIIYGHKVSMANMGAVCTHPQYRGRGIGTQLLNMVFDRLNEEEVSVVTISGTRGLYRRNQCVEAGGMVTYVLDKQSYSYWALGGMEYEISKQFDDTGVLCDVYQREAVRYQRSRMEFPVLLKAVPMVHPPVDALTTLVAFREGRKDSALAYLIGYENKPGVFKVVEYAGERLAVWWLAGKLLEHAGMNGVILEVPIYDAVLSSILSSEGIRGINSYYPSTTVRITNKSSLWREIYPIVEEMWHGGDKPPCGIEDLPGNVYHDLEELTTFLFAGFNRHPYGAPWDRIFPIPLPWPNGLNYV